METLYFVRFTGRLQAGLSPEDVVTNLINLTNLDPEKAQSLLSSGKARVLKKEADLETAEKYRTTFEKAGMVMQVERMNATVPPLPALSKAETVQYATLATDNSAPQADLTVKKETTIHVYETPKSNLVIPKENTSGQGKGTEIPDGVRGWSWGAFLLNWIWAIGNKTWIGLLAMIPYVGFIMAIVLGAKGREWAWQNKEWKSVEHFQSVQKRWAFWGLILLIIPLLGIIAAVVIPMFAQP
jgi:hypothetical protein